MAEVSLRTKVRSWLMILYFMISTLADYITVICGLPLRLFNKDIARAWMDLGKRNFGVSLIALTQALWSAKVVFYAENPALRRSFKVDSAGRLTSQFDSRAVVIANHQLYSDWMYLWWVAYTSNLHGAMTIALKRSLRQIPIFGWGMQHLNFLFLSRNWKRDQAEIAKSTKMLASDPTWPSWLLLFPEGTTSSQNGVDKSRAYALKTGLTVPKNLLLPRVRGLQASLQGLSGSVSTLYDFTVYYSGIPEGTFGENHYTLKKMFFEGISAKEIRMHIREFDIKDIPYLDDDKFAAWVNERWAEKDVIFDKLRYNDPELEKLDPITAKPQLNSITEVYAPFNVPVSLALFGRLFTKYLI